MESKNDQGVYYMNSNQDKVIVGVYLDDLIIMGASEAKVGFSGSGVGTGLF